MFTTLEPYCKFDKIVIVGPQRSGTRFATWAIAHDLGLKFIDQRGIRINKFSHLVSALDTYDRVAIQGTGCTHCIHKLKRDDTLVVYVRRLPAHVLASQQRIQWQEETWEAAKIPEKYRIYPLCEGRFQYWRDEQCLSIPNWTILPYDSLRQHPLFIDEKDRARLNGGQGMPWNSCTGVQHDDLNALDGGTA